MTEQPTLRPSGAGPYDAAGKIALVSGGSSGIGAACVRRLAAAGSVVWIGYNTGAERATALAATLPGEHHRAVHLPITDTAALNQAAAALMEAHGRLDILVNSAGTTSPVPHADLDALDDATFDRIMVTNVRGPFATIRACRALLAASGDSIVVNISSLSGSTGLGSSIAYCASKAALDTMGLSLARVLAPNTRVIGIAPAAVATGFVAGRGRAAIEKQAASTPLRTVAEADDVALAVMAAITGLRLTTGSTLVIDGGRHL